MENSRGFEKYGTVHTRDYRMMQGSGHTGSNLQNNPLWFDVASNLYPGKKSLVACDAKSLHLKNWDTLGFGNKITFHTEYRKNSPIPALPLNISHQEKSQRLLYRASSLPSLAKETFPENRWACDSQAVSQGTSGCRLTDENFKEHKSAALSICGNSETTNRHSMSKSRDEGLCFEDPKRELIQSGSTNILPWPRCFSDIADDPEEHDSSVDLLEAETFFSVKSGSFYSRSSSQCSLADSTDIGQCIFEEALEDLSSLALDRQFHESPIVPYSEIQSPLWDPSVKYVNHPTDEGITKTAISKQGHTSCNTELLRVSLSYNDKETQTRKSTQDTGVNTDPIQHGLYSQVAAPKGVRAAKEVEESKPSEPSSSLSVEALLQRAVKAELRLVDVHRWLCWQMCWNTQQQTIEKQSFFNLSREPIEQSTSKMNFSLSSALAEVEEKYQEMRAKIQSGIPLDSLVPLIMQVTTFEMSPENLPKNTNVPVEDLKQQDKSVKNNFEESFLSCMDKCEQQPNEIHPAEHLSEKSSHYHVHVGNIASCVKEIQLVEVFQKYHVLNVFLEESSLTCSYAVLTFSKSEEAEAVIKEMDGKMFFGKKLKVRVIKTPNYNLALAFQKIKSVSGEIPQDGKGRCDMFEAQEGSGSPISKSDSYQCDWTQAAPVCGNVTNPHVNMPSNKGYPHMNTNLRPPVTPPSNTFGFCNSITPNHQWMLPARYSYSEFNNNMPNCMYVPYSYTLYKLPNHPPMPAVSHPPMPAVSHPPMPAVSHPPMPAVSHPPMPPVSHPFSFIGKKPYANNRFGKDHGSPVRAKPVKPIHGNHQSNSGTLRPVVLNQVQIPTDKTEPLKSDTDVKIMDNKPATVNSVSEEISFTASSCAKPNHSETASQDDSLKMSVSVTTPGILDVETSVSDSFFSCDEQKNISGPANVKTAAPLRSPTFVPPSVTIPSANKLSENNNSNSKVLIVSAKQAKASSSVSSLQKGSLPPGKMDWGVYPKLDTSSELPIVIIPNQLNFSQFKRVIKHLGELHKDATREQIVKALEEVWCNRGSFGGLTIPEIIFAVSSKLAGNNPPA
ncbi:RNA-binding protein 44 [Dendrobates tinctorius]|uniref:RNA-binding protein 44 n=1 Tax=Dendrobates tinctorius TaxID=92724 RepID=UPI003CC95331